MLKKCSLLACLFLSVFSSSIAAKPKSFDSNYSPSENWKKYQTTVLSYQSQIPGWCCPEKAIAMMDLIYEVKPKICVEIGVFGGSSIYPTASALKFLKQGTVYAIDPWMTSPCLEGYGPENPNYQWWNHLNLESIYLGFVKMLQQFHLYPYCEVLRMRSDDALTLFADESIDILHIDGNHTEDVALSDAQMYLPKVKRGGYIWFDDVNWTTTGSALAFLALFCIKDDARSTDKYVLLRKN